MWASPKSLKHVSFLVIGIIILFVIHLIYINSIYQSKNSKMMDHIYSQCFQESIAFIKNQTVQIIDPPKTCVHGIWDKEIKQCVCDDRFIGNVCHIPIISTCEKDEKREKAFDEIFNKNMWGNNESRSGEGSTVKWTEELRKFLKNIIIEHEIKSFLDSPCGDFNWMRYTEFPEDFQYVGIDISPSIVHMHRNNYSNHYKYQFLHRDMATLPPYKAFDVIFSRDVLQHLPMADINQILKNWENSGSKYLVTTFYTGAWGNSNIQPGEYFPINPMHPPFNFVDPIVSVRDKITDDLSTHYGAIKNMGLWKLPIQRKPN
jgi:SAM-dependent methyltransferase